MLLVTSDYIALMVGLMNNELGKIWKAYYPRYCLDRLTKTTKYSEQMMHQL
jgi:hypothetical protein